MLLPLISSNSTHILNDSTIYQDKVNILFLHFQISMINLIPFSLKPLSFITIQSSMVHFSSVIYSSLKIQLLG